MLGCAMTTRALVLLISLVCSADCLADFRAGAATSNITPPLGEMIVGGWQPIPATHIHDELHARCLVLDDGQNQLAIVICDLLCLPREVCDLAKQQASAATSIPAKNILIAATHTHSATRPRGPNRRPYADDLTDYQKFVARRIADGISRASNQLEPATLAFGSASEPSEVFNRRWYTTNPAHLQSPFGRTDKVRMNPPRGNAALTKPAGPTDPEIAFVSVRATAGHHIALLANYSLHYVGGVGPGHVSADYFGYFCRDLLRKIDGEEQEPPFVPMLSNGTSGDINNINFRERSPRRKSYEKMKIVADKVSSRVHEQLSSLQYSSDIKLNVASSNLKLRLRKPTQKTMEYLRDFVSTEKPDPNGRRSKQAIYLERLTMIEKSPDYVEVPLQVLKIGEIAICAIPFETFVEIGLELKERLPAKHTFTVELANSWHGYLPTPEQHELGGYETWLGTNYVQTDASRMIVDELLKLASNLQNRSD